MKKFLLKVTGITLLSILALACIAYAALLIFTPVTLAKFYDGVGNYDKALVHAYEQYKRSEDLSDLDAACRYALKTGDKDKIGKYLEMLVDREDFYSYCLSDPELGAEYYDFICVKYVAALYDGGNENAAALANGLTKTYTATCPLRSIAVSATDKNDKTTAAAVKTFLKDRLNTAVDEKENALITADIGLIDEFLGK